MKVFMPYLVWNTVFDNTRVTTELGRKPVPFSQYSYPAVEVQPGYEFHLSLSGLAGRGGRVRGMMDFMLEAWVSSHHRELESWAGCWARARRWQPGEKLKLLFAGYNGTRNMGSDVRVEEMLRQIRHILGADKR